MALPVSQKLNILSGAMNGNTSINDHQERMAIMIKMETLRFETTILKQSDTCKQISCIRPGRCEWQWQGWMKFPIFLRVYEGQWNPSELLIIQFRLT
jgi:hypothetical protein